VSGALLVIGRDEVAAHLAYEICIPLMREAMIALSRGRTRQSLRSIVDLDGGRAFGTMPGAMLGGPFGAKLISVFPGSADAPSHQGLVVLFDPATGAPVCLVDASELTAIRTAAASAAATDALAPPGASRLAIIGTGEQARRHAEALVHVRPIGSIRIWGRSGEKAAALAGELGAKLGLPVEPAATVGAAVEDAEIVCTTTAAPEPVLFSRQVGEGTHLNLVGSSRAGPAEVDSELVRRARFFADHEEGALRQGAEFLIAKEKGLVGDDHVLGEIGEVMAGTLAGRTSAGDVTIYKSLGSIVQDLAAGWWLYERARERGFGVRVPI
jgi:ornithine cyclodeaminase